MLVLFVFALSAGAASYYTHRLEDPKAAYVASPGSGGRLFDTIDVPERPLQLVLGGTNCKTLFIPARTSLYSVRLR